MESENVSKAATEVLDILKHTKKSDVEKIPQDFIDFLEQIKDKDYIVNLDYTKYMSDMNLNSLTEALLGVIYMRYWATDEDKKLFIEKLKNNQIQYEINKKEVEKPKKQVEINSDNNVQINNEKLQDDEKNTLQDVIRHKNIIQKIIDKIISLFRRKRD